MCVVNRELSSPRRPSEGPLLRIQALGSARPPHPPPCPGLSSLSPTLSVRPLSTLMGRRKRAQQQAMYGGRGRRARPGRAGLCLGRVVTTRRAGAGPAAHL